MATQEEGNLEQTAKAILAQTTQLTERLSRLSIAPPSLSVGASSELWTTHDADLDGTRSSILALMQHLEKLLHGPHGFLHEYVSTNWEYGALYTLLEFNILEKIPLDGAAVPVLDLAEESSLPVEKLLRICRLVACAGILDEPKEGYFAHTVISEELVRDQGFKSFIGFQTFETRVASAHLADSLKKPNPYWTGQAAFEHAWGLPMYGWHAKNPEKGKRFAQAMESVSQGLDPGNAMIVELLGKLRDGASDSKGLLVDIAGKTGSFCQQLAVTFPNMEFEVQDPSAELLARGQQTLLPSVSDRVVFRQRDMFAPRSTQDTGAERGFIRTIFLLRSVLWNLRDDDCLKLLRSFIPALQHQSRPMLLINDLVSPGFGTFEPSVERAYRRRDVTLMTMHNCKQRTMKEWVDLMQRASAQFKITYSQKYTSHSSRGLWRIQLD